MSKSRVIDPINRVEGDMAIRISVNDKNMIDDAEVLGFVYRGFENIFIGKRPFDAMRMSQRACGVCPVSHGTAGAQAIEKASGVSIPRNAQLVRDIVLGTNIVVSHATHFYFMWGPDLVDKAYKESQYFDELVRRFNPLQSQHLKEILKHARIPLHAVVATFGGKFPHPMHAVPGGVTSMPKHIELIKTITRLKNVKSFIEKEVLNGITMEQWAEVKTLAQVQELLKNEQFANSDIGLFIRVALDLGLHTLGEGSPKNFLAYGFGVQKDGSWLFRPGYLEEGHHHELDESHVSEDTAHSYYENETEWHKPIEGRTKPAPKKESAYSWIKSPRYFGHVVEAGPLARQLVNKDPLITDLVQHLGVNTFTRTIARLHEIVLIIPHLLTWVDEIDLEKPFYTACPEIASGEGVGLVEAPRGALGHWINIENFVCKSYQIITPTTWNGSPKDSKGQKGAIEQALIGVHLSNKDSSLEAAHIVRSFDPCISCSIHTIGKKRPAIRIELH